MNGYVIMHCDYCEVPMGALDFSPTQENLNIIGVQFCCRECLLKRKPSYE